MAKKTSNTNQSSKQPISTVEDQIKLEKLLLQTDRDRNSLADALKQKKVEEIDLDERRLKIREAELRLDELLEKAQLKKDKALVEDLRKRKAKLAIVKEEFETQEEIVEVLQEQNKVIDSQLKKANKLIGAFTSPLKSLEKFGDTLKEKVMNRFKLSLTDTNKSLTSIVKTGLQAGLVGGLMLAVHRAIHLNEELVHIRKSLGVSAEEATHLHHAVEKAAIKSKVLGAVTEDYVHAFEQVVNEYGTAAAENAKLLDTQVLLTKQIGMSAEEASAFRSMSEGTGKSVEENLISIRDQVEEYNHLTKDSISVRQIQQAISKTSIKTLAAYKGNTKALGAAVIQAQKLGMELSQIESATDSLLDIESSIGKEMEARVLTGKEINFDEARLLKLQGKSDEAMASMLKQVGSYSEYMDMAPYQQESLAEAMGVSVDQLGKSLQLAEKDRQLGKKRMADLTAADRKKLIDAKIYSQEQIDQAIRDEQAVSAKDKMAQISNKLMTIFDKYVAGPLTKMIDLFTTGLDYIDRMVISSKKFIKAIMPDWMIDSLKSVGGIAMGVGAVVGGIKLFKGIGSFMSRGTKENPMVTTGSGEGDDEKGGIADALSGKGKKGMKSAMSRMKAGFRKGGLKGGLKGLATSGLGKSMLSGAASLAPMAIAGLGSKIEGSSTSQTGQTVGQSMQQTGQSGMAKEGLSWGASLLGKAGSFLGKLNPIEAVKNIFGKFSGKIAGKLPNIFKKIPMIGSLVETVMAAGDIKSAAASGKSKEEINQMIGKRVLQGLGGILGGIGGASLVQALNVVPGLGVLLTPLAGIAGDFLGRGLMGILSDQIGAAPVGDAVVKTFGLGKGINAKDALVRPGQPPILFDKGDMIMAMPESSLGGGSSTTSATDDVPALLKQLITAVSQPVVIKIGNKVVNEIDRVQSMNRSYVGRVDNSYGAV